MGKNDLRCTCERITLQCEERLERELDWMLVNELRKLELIRMSS